MVFVLSLFDAASSISFMLGQAPKTWTDGACHAQGFFISLFCLMTVFWTSCTAINLYMWVCLRRNERDLREYLPGYLGVSIVVPFIIAVTTAAADVYGDANLWCWVKGTHVSWQFGAFYIWVIFGWTITLGVFLMVQGQVTKRLAADGAETRSAADEKLSRLMLQYVLIFVFLWFWGLLNRLVISLSDGEANFATMFFHSFFVPQQGFWNAVVYGRVHKRLRKLLFPKDKDKLDELGEGVVPPELSGALQHRELHACVVTWNMAEQEPGGLEVLFKKGKELYVLGVQECMHIEEIRARVEDAIGGKDYTFYSRKIGQTTTEVGYHGYIGVLAWVRNDVVQSDGFEARDMAMGQCFRGRKIGNQRMSNKGAVGLAFRFWHTSVAVLSCHLTSDKDGTCKVESRNEDHADILRTIQYDYDDLGFEYQDTQHVCFFLGDLNYRMKASVDEAIQMVSTAMSTRDEEDWKHLLQHDELSTAREASQIFTGWQEAPIRFPPTYRRRQGPDGLCKDFADPVQIKNAYSTEVEKRGTVTLRTPSYTDRILWHTLPACQDSCLCTNYSQEETIRSSDHNPVRAEFAIQASQGADMAHVEAAERRTWGSNNFMVKLSNLRWEDALQVSSQDAPPRRVEVVFPIQAEDPQERSRKLHNVQAALEVDDDDDGTSHWQRSWHVTLEEASSPEGFVFRASASHHGGMHMLLKLLDGKEQVVAQGVVSMRAIAIEGKDPAFETECSRGGRKVGRVAGDAAFRWISHAEAEEGASEAEESVEAGTSRPSPPPKGMTMAPIGVEEKEGPAVLLQPSSLV